MSGLASTWDEPGAVAVAPGVHRIPLPLPGDGLRAVNVYAIEDGGRIALVDGGSPHPEAGNAIKAGLAEIGAGLADVSVVLCTHGHYDHYGLATAVSAASGATVALGEHELGLLRAASQRDVYQDSVRDRRRWLRRHGAGAIIGRENPAGSDRSAPGAAWRLPDRWLIGGEQVELAERTLRVLWTPGHTRGHVVFHDLDDGLLFAGDHVLPHITPSLGFEPFPDGRALELFLSSLELVRGLAVELVLPGHGAEFADLDGRVDALVEHHRERLARCLALLSRSPGSASEVARGLKWTRSDRDLTELDAFNRMLAVMETATHLELLVRDGHVRHNDDDDGLRTYAIAA